MEDLGPQTDAGTAINDAGKVSGAGPAGTTFLWDGAVATVNSSCCTRVINASGHVLIQSGSWPALWDGTTVQTLGTLGVAAIGVDLNDSNQVAGYFRTGIGRNTRPFLWDGTAMIDLGNLGGDDEAEAHAINAAGQVTGWSFTSSGEQHAFLWDGTTMLDLGVVPGAVGAGGWKINSLGHVVGVAYGYGPNYQDRAFLWDGTAMHDLNSLVDPSDPLQPYVTLTGGYDDMAINDQGQILSKGIDSRNGESHVYLLSPVETGGSDSDGDGIADAVDTNDGTASNGFDDGEGTSGSITDRAGLEVTIEDAASPDGVRVVVGAGGGPVTLDACGFTETVAANSELIITCGSVTVNVIQGAAQIVLEGRPTVISVGVGATASVSDNGDGTVLVQNVGDAGEVIVTVEGTETPIAPGGSQSYTVVYSFDGFYSPVDKLPTLNAANAGRAIPVKFSLGGDQGLAIFAVGYPKSQKVYCDSSATIDMVEETVTAGSSSLSYVDGQYHYVWKTDKAWFGTCRQLIVKLNDGSAHVANFKFK